MAVALTTKQSQFVTEFVRAQRAGVTNPALAAVKVVSPTATERSQAVIASKLRHNPRIQTQIAKAEKQTKLSDSQSESEKLYENCSPEEQVYWDKLWEEVVATAPRSLVIAVLKEGAQNSPNSQWTKDQLAHFGVGPSAT